MSKNATKSSRPPISQRLWKPVVATGAGGTATVVWFEEIVRYGEEILALIFLPFMAAGFYLLNIFIFKSRTPRDEDVKRDTEKGVGK